MSRTEDTRAAISNAYSAEARQATALEQIAINTAIIADVLNSSGTSETSEKRKKLITELEENKDYISKTLTQNIKDKYLMRGRWVYSPEKRTLVCSNCGCEHPNGVINQCICPQCKWSMSYDDDKVEEIDL